MDGCAAIYWFRYLFVGILWIFYCHSPDNFKSVHPYKIFADGLLGAVCKIKNVLCCLQFLFEPLDEHCIDALVGLNNLLRVFYISFAQLDKLGALIYLNKRV